MKKIYLTLLIAFLGGQVMAQSTAVTTNKKEATKANSSATLSTSTVTNNTSNQNGTTDQIAKTEVTQTGPLAKNPAKTNLPEVDLPGFPVYVETGNVQLDKTNYIAAKDKWISENQVLYNDYMKSKNNTIK